MFNKNTIYLKPLGGLGNRMRAIDSSVQLAKKHGKNLVILWQPNSGLNCRFTDLFLPSSSFTVQEVDENDSSYPDSLGKSRRLRWNPFKATPKIITENKVAIADRELFKIYNAKKLGEGMKPEALQENFYTNIKPILANLSNPESSAYISSCFRLHPSPIGYPDFKPISVLQQKIDCFTSPFNLTTGIHIRRTDHGPAKKYSSIDIFVQKIEVQLHNEPKSTFLLSTDCLETEQQLKEQFKETIITYPKAYAGRNNLLGIQEALIEMYCLSRSEKIWGSFSSTFSEVAASIGHIPLEIVR